VRGRERRGGKEEGGKAVEREAGDALLKSLEKLVEAHSSAQSMTAFAPMSSPPYICGAYLLAM
jgi:molybdenum-dependent DNA-binding transcriptional regulator ModE